MEFRGVFYADHVRFHSRHPYIERVRTKHSSITCLGLLEAPILSLQNVCIEEQIQFFSANTKYSGTSDKGPSEIGTTSLQRTLASTPS